MRRLGLGLLWVIGLWPLLLLLLFYSLGPMPTVQLQIVLESWAGQLGLVLLVLGGIALLIYPPFPAGVRLLASRTLARMNTDREPLLRAQSDLRNFESAARHLEAGRAAVNTGSPEMAIPHLVRSLELEPSQPAAMHKLGEALLELGQAKAAIGPLARTVELSPEQGFGAAMLLLGRAYMRDGQLQKAAEVFARHAREHGGSRKSLYWRGLCLRRSGDEAGAREVFTQAAAPPIEGSKLIAEEGWYRACARVALWGRGGKS